MAFMDVRFPSDISIGAVGGPGFMTEVVGLGSGFESRNQRWSEARCSWDVAKACKNEAFRARLIAFFRLCKGKAHGFRFKDYSDFKVSRLQGVFIATDTDDVYQLGKRYSLTGMGTDDRPITKPRIVTVYGPDGIALSPGVDFTLDMATGLMTMQGLPAADLGWWVGEFDVPARFDTDKLPLTAESLEFFRASSIQVVEIRV